MTNDMTDTRNSRSSVQALARLAAVAALAIGVLVAGAGAAQAAWTTHEGFEPPSSVRFFHAGNADGRILHSRWEQRSGSYHAVLYTWAGSWSALERTVNKPRDYADCYAQAYVRPVHGEKRTGYLEVLDGGSGRVLKRTPFTISGPGPSGPGYHLIPSGRVGALWVTKMLVRVVMVHTGLYYSEGSNVDDLTVTCHPSLWS